MPTSTNAFLAGEKQIDDGNDAGSKFVKKFGYSTGTGAAVTQITNRATGVTINALCGQITTDATSLAAEASAKFTVTNSKVEEGDIIILSFRDAVALNTDVVVTDTADGSFELTVINNNVAAGTAETGAIVINFAVIKAVAA